MKKLEEFEEEIQQLINEKLISFCISRFEKLTETEKLSLKKEFLNIKNKKYETIRSS